MKFSFLKDRSNPFRENKIHELTLEEENQLEKNLIWVFASPRSGTQWLGTQLLEHNTIICHGPSIGLNLGSIHQGFTDKVVRQIEFRGDEPDYFLSKQYKDIWTFFMRKFILNRLFSQYKDLTKKIVIPDPEGSIGADIIASCLQNSTAIVLFRDGRDVVDSIIDAAKPDSWHVKTRGLPPLKPEKRKNRIKLASRRWVRQVEILEDIHENILKKSLKIKYEDLKKNTLNELISIYRFMEIEISNQKLEELVNKYSFNKIPDSKKGTGQVTRSASPGKWKENFSEDEQMIMNDIMNEKLKELGYL